MLFFCIWMRIIFNCPKIRLCLEMVKHVQVDSVPEQIKPCCPKSVSHGLIFLGPQRDSPGHSTTFTFAHSVSSFTLLLFFYSLTWCWVLPFAFGSSSDLVLVLFCVGSYKLLVQVVMSLYMADRLAAAALGGWWMGVWFHGWTIGWAVLVELVKTTEHVVC